MSSDSVTAIKSARLIDGNGGPVLEDAVIVIKGKRIESVGKSGEVDIPEGAKVVDAGSRTVMPGMFDCHIHIACLNPATVHNYRVAQFEIPVELQAFYALYHAQLCFQKGFTTLRDLGRMTPIGQITPHLLGIRDSIDAGIMVGPRIIAAGRVVITNSHLDLTLPRAADRRHFYAYTADGPYGLRKLVRQQLRFGVDWVKTAASGGGGTDKEEPDIRNMTQEELDAIVDEAHAFHTKVAVHCFTTESQRMSIKAGADTIEHVVFSDDETTKMIKDSNTPMVPTLLHRTDEAIESRRNFGTPDFVLKKMKKIQPYTFESFQRVHDAGIKIAMGTDMGLDPLMGTNAKELEIYVNLGMTPMEALQTATKNAAEILHLDKSLGTLEPGKLADVLIIDGDPSEDITVLQKQENINMVMKEGQAFLDTLSDEKRYIVHPEPKTIKKLDAL